jgi:hypothetical protein
MSSISVSWQGREHVVALAQEDTLREIGLKIAEATGTSLETLKLLQGGRVIVPSRAPADKAIAAGTPSLHLQARACHAWHRHHALHCNVHEQESACSTELLLLLITGLQPDSRVRLLASAAHDVAAVRSARDMPGLAGLEHESQRAAARRRTVGGADVTLPTGSSPPAWCGSSREHMWTCALHVDFGFPHHLLMYAGPYTFQRFQTWDDLPMDAFPSPAHALKLLHRLAADRGIVAIMAKHKWRCVTMRARLCRS